MIKLTSEEARAIKKYCDFMYNPDNEFNCTDCPENAGKYDNRYPCGQQNCLVSCHCRIDRDKERYM